jgi:lysyl-tRNA synthetase class 1
MQENTDMRYWLDQLAAKIIEAHPEGEIIISSGISPSGPYHVGHAREILTADAVRRVLIEKGRKARHLHFVDNFDTLRKRYPYLDESYEDHVGKPLYMIPAPDGKSDNYGEQFFGDYQKSAKMLGVEMEIHKANELYCSGKYSEMINLCLKHRDKIADILFKISGRELDDSWRPIQILDESSGKLNTAKFLDYDFEDNTVD